MQMKKAAIFGAALAAAFAAAAQGVAHDLGGGMKLKAADAGGWKFAWERSGDAAGVETVEIKISRAAPAAPPAFTLEFMTPQLDVHHKWTPTAAGTSMPPNWMGGMQSRLGHSMPLTAYLNDSDRNRATVAASESMRLVRMDSGLEEKSFDVEWKLGFFSEPEAPIGEYSVKVRIDRRDVFFGKAIEEAADWMGKAAGLKPAPTPEVAHDPLYSTWYSFLQEVSAAEVEAECREAAKLGMKAVILDGGWNTDVNVRGGIIDGDWKISEKKFPDMAAHVRRVQGMGMKYVMWFGVPKMGLKSANHKRFEGKFLYTLKGPWAGFSCLDPRFPEVREYLAGTFGKAVKEWGIDGLKLDFIDLIGFRGEDPAVKENYAGRDIKALPEAVDALLGETAARVRAVKPEALIEFRQPYTGPAIRQHGNMMRATDCPGDMRANRFRTANLRLASGGAAVHADMLRWNSAEKTEVAARHVLSAMFSTIQYSVMLRELPEEHRRMTAHWLKFSAEHREALLKGEFRPHLYQANYPWIEGESADELVVGIYAPGFMAEAGDGAKRTYLLNGTGEGEVAFRSGFGGKAKIYDTFGEAAGEAEVKKGANVVRMPVSGYLELIPSAK